LTVFYELIAFPCGARYSMPLGVYSWDPGYFRVYHSAGMARLYRGGPLVLLAPRDPVLYLESLEHRLEREIAYASGCPLPEPRLGAWYSCLGVPLAGEPGADWYACVNPRRIAGELFHAYTRAYGCLVELLVIYTKLLANAIDEVPHGLVEGLSRCVERSTRGGRLADASQRVVQAIREVLRGG